MPTTIGVSLPNAIGDVWIATRRRPPDQKKMDDWRERLRAALEEKGFNMKSASLKAGLNAAAVQQIVTNGKDARAGTLQQLAEAHGLSLDAILLNRPAGGQPQLSSSDVRLAAVVGTVGAGLWFSLDSPPHLESEPVPYVPCRYPDLEQTAYKVVGPSMNRRKIEDGDFVIAVPYWDARIAPVAGDVAIVERSRDGGLVEWTIKEIEVTREAVRLIPRSDDPDYQEALVIPRTTRADMYDAVRIVALVVGKFSPV